jgi:lia operon protein LiaG
MLPVTFTTATMAAALATTTLASQASAQGGDDRSLTGRDIAIYNLVGSATLVAGSGSAVQVSITRHGADAGKLTIATGSIRGRETLRVIYPADRIRSPQKSNRDWESRTDLRVREDGTFDDGGDGWDGHRVRIGGDGLDASADLKIAVPKGQHLVLHLAVGDVHATNVEGDLSLEASSADVTVLGARGDLRVETGSGRVSVTDASGDVSVETGSGGMSLAKIAGHSLHAEAGSGRVSVEGVTATEVKIETGSGGVDATGIAARRVSIEAGSGRVTAELVARADDLSIETGSGGVTVTLPRDYGAELSVDGGGGRRGIESDFPITTNHASTDEIRGTIGDGKGRLRIETGSGGVRLRRA